MGVKRIDRRFWNPNTAWWGSLEHDQPVSVLHQTAFSIFFETPGLLDVQTWWNETAKGQESSFCDYQWSGI